MMHSSIGRSCLLQRPKGAQVFSRRGGQCELQGWPRSSSLGTLEKFVHIMHGTYCGAISGAAYHLHRGPQRDDLHVSILIHDGVTLAQPVKVAHLTPEGIHKLRQAVQHESWPQMV